MKPFVAFVLGVAITALILAVVLPLRAQTLVQSDDPSSSLIHTIGDFSVAIPEGGTGVVSQKDWIYVIKPSRGKIYAISKTSSTNDKADQYEMRIP
ncbi:MAG: hypothetical protein ACOYON_06350 [Fimbriimonas sp.]